MNDGRRPALDASARAAVAAAISDAESRTSGEIIVVVARQSGSYAWTSLVWGALAALLVPVGLLLAGVDPIAMARVLEGGWRVGHDADVAGDAATGMAMTVALQAALFLAVSLLGLWGPAREFMTPAFVKRHTVHRAALDQFLAHGIHLTEARTGVLIYASLAEHQAEIVADTGIYAKVDRAIWSGAVAGLLERAKADDLAGGLILAVERAGETLAAHFPPSDANRDELPNAVVLL